MCIKYHICRYELVEFMGLKCSMQSDVVFEQSQHSMYDYYGDVFAHNTLGLVLIASIYFM